MLARVAAWVMATAWVPSRSEDGDRVTVTRESVEDDRRANNDWTSSKLLSIASRSLVSSRVMLPSRLRLIPTEAAVRKSPTKPATVPEMADRSDSLSPRAVESVESGPAVPPSAAVRVRVLMVASAELRSFTKSRTFPPPPRGRSSPSP
jgi:hypothetical protein